MTAILITGASSGLGAALAEIYAQSGTTLFLGGRDQARLDAVAQNCRGKGATVMSEIIDVTDQDAMARWIGASDAQTPLTLVIANAGISGGTGNRLGENDEQTRAIFGVNVDGVLNTVLPAVPLMKARKSGQIAIMASMAGFRGLPSAPAYCASKAAVRVWGEGLRVWLKRDGVQVNVICPGFVETAMTAKNRFPMPFLMGAERAARIMRDGLAKDRPRIGFPWRMGLLVWLLAALPPGWVDRMVSRAPGK